MCLFKAGFHSIAQIGPKLARLQPPEFWGNRCVLLHLGWELVTENCTARNRFTLGTREQDRYMSGTVTARDQMAGHRSDGKGAR